MGDRFVIERPSRFAFTFSMPQFAPDASRIVIAIAPERSDCAMMDTGEGLPADHRETTAQGMDLDVRGAGHGALQLASRSDIER